MVSSLMHEACQVKVTRESLFQVASVCMSETLTYIRTYIHTCLQMYVPTYVPADPLALQAMCYLLCQGVVTYLNCP